MTASKIKIFFTVFFLLCIIKTGSAQILEAKVGVDGFTCSLCAKGVEGQLKDLDFVKSVSTDLKNSTFTLKTYSGKQIDISRIKDAVSDGGFTLRSIQIKAEGTVSSSSKGSFLKTTNSPEVKFESLSSDIKDGDKVSVTGTIDPANYTLKVKTIKKL